MNFLDEILKEMVKEYEKERNSHQDYASQEDLKNEFNKKELPRQNNFDTTFHFNLNNEVDKTSVTNENKKEKDMLLFSKNNKINTDRVITDSIAKGCDKVKAVIDNRKDLNKGDIVRIIDGDYKALSNKECKFLEYYKGMDKILLQLDELNPLYVNPEDIELVRKDKKKYKATTFNKIEDKYENIIVEIENDMLTVTLQDGTKSKKQLKGENKTKIIKISYYDAKIKQYLKESKELIDTK